MDKNDYVKKMQEMIDGNTRWSLCKNRRQNLNRLEAVSGFII